MDRLEKFSVVCVHMFSQNIFSSQHGIGKCTLRRLELEKTQYLMLMSNLHQNVHECQAPQVDDEVNHESALKGLVINQTDEYSAK